MSQKIKDYLPLQKEWTQHNYNTILVL